MNTIIFLVLALVFSVALYVAHETGRGKPINFKKVLAKHGNLMEWEVLAGEIGGNKRHQSIICATRMGGREVSYPVYFDAKDILGVEETFKIPKYFSAQNLPYTEHQKYALYPHPGR